MGFRVRKARVPLLQTVTSLPFPRTRGFQRGTADGRYCVGREGGGACPGDALGFRKSSHVQSVVTLSPVPQTCGVHTGGWGEAEGGASRDPGKRPGARFALL